MIHLGLVTGFDEARGLGTVTDDAGAAWPFHCTAIADGSRRADVGARVAFRVVAGHLGREEATQVTELGRAQAPGPARPNPVGSAP